MTPARVIRPQFPPGRRILAVSDIHGNLTFFQKLLDQAGPVSWREADKCAPPPALVGPLNDTAWWMLALCVLPVAAAVAVYSRKK